MSRTPQSTSSIRSASSWTTPPRYRNFIVCFYLCPAASATNGGTRDARSRVCSSMVSVFFFETWRPSASKMVTLTVIIFSSPAADFETVSASSACSMPHTTLRTRANGSLSLPALSSLRWTRSCAIPSFSLKRTRTTCSAVAKNGLNSSNGNSTTLSKPLRDVNAFPVLPCGRSPHVRTGAHMPSLNWRITASSGFRMWRWHELNSTYSCCTSSSKVNTRFMCLATQRLVPKTMAEIMNLPKCIVTSRLSSLASRLGDEIGEFVGMTSKYPKQERGIDSSAPYHCNISW